MSKKLFAAAAAPALATMIHGYRARVMELNGVSPDVGGAFAVDPSIEQKLEDKIRENADFLGEINVVGVRDLEGDKVGLDVTGTIAKRTDTDAGDRQTADNLALADSRYRCEKTEFDTHIKWSTLDSWRKFPDFQQRITGGVTRQIARDRLTIGFNGESADAVTDSIANPLLQDVNIGWLKHVETRRPGSFLTGIKVGAGAGADFKNIDQAIYAARHELISPWNRNDTSLNSIMGTGLVVDKNLSTIGAFEEPTERAALQTLIANQLIGTLKTKFVPFFPERSVFITSPDNLSIYYQEGSRRRHIVDNPKRDRLEDYQTLNEAYVVEDLDKCALLSNILLWDEVGAAWV